MVDKTITVIVERTENNYSAYLDGIDGIVTTGNDLDEIKKNMNEAINLYLEACKDYNYDIPEALKGDYSLSFRMDVMSMLNYYSGIFTKAGLERITGINQKQLWHYAKGIRNPRPEQVLKIETALHKLGNELTSINL